MRKSLLVIGLLAGIVYACNQQDKTASHLLSTNNLPKQVVSKMHINKIKTAVPILSGQLLFYSNIPIR